MEYLLFQVLFSIPNTKTSLMNELNLHCSFNKILLEKWISDTFGSH